MQFIDDAEFQVAIDLDGGGKITSIKWREMEFTVPVRGSVLSSGWTPLEGVLFLYPPGENRVRWAHVARATHRVAGRDGD